MHQSTNLYSQVQIYIVNVCNEIELIIKISLKDILLIASKSYACNIISYFMSRHEHIWLNNNVKYLDYTRYWKSVENDTAMNLGECCRLNIL